MAWLRFNRPHGRLEIRGANNGEHSWQRMSDDRWNRAFRLETYSIADATQQGEQPSQASKGDGGLFNHRLLWDRD